MGLISRVSSRTYRNCTKAKPKMGNKPRGIKCARKLRNTRRTNRWADLDYKKAHLGTTLKANPFGGSSHAKGIVVEKLGVEAKQPNSAIRKCVRVQLIKNSKRITAFGRSGHAVGDIPGVRFKVVKVAGVSLLALFKGKKERPRSKTSQKTLTAFTLALPYRYRVIEL